MYYHVQPLQPEAHLFQVTCRFTDPAPEGQEFSLPTWIPGSYMVRDFGKNIVQMVARVNGESVEIIRIDKSRWRLPPCAGKVELIYDIYAWDLSVRAAHLDTTHAYFNGTSLFLKIHGKEELPCSVELLPPDGSTYDDWRVATTLTRAQASPYGFGLYQADNYDELIDHPVEMGVLSVASFDVQGVSHDVVLSGRHDADMARICADLKPICEAHVALFDGLPPMSRYLFLTWVVGKGYGGLEHRTSTSLMCSRNDLPLVGQKEISDAYQSYLGLCSHEYFHTWNIKRIKPEAYVPYDLSQEAYTRQLWAFEGITSYYDDLALVRSATITPQVYLNTLAKVMTRVWRGKGRFKQSVADSSFDAWTKFYRQDENAPNAIVSYYTKGSLIALALDLSIRLHSAGAKSLDDVMRQLWRSYGEPGVGVPEGRVEQLCSEVAGQDLSGFFQDYLYGTQDPPLAALLAQFGVVSRLRPAESASDLGGQAIETTDKVLIDRPVLGVRTVNENGQLKLANVFDGGAAQCAGLSAGDVLVAMAGIKVTADSFEANLKRFKVGSCLEFHVFRRDELMVMSVTLQSPPHDTWDLKLLEDVDGVVLQRRQAWLHG